MDDEGVYAAGDHRHRKSQVRSNPSVNFFVFTFPFVLNAIPSNSDVNLYLHFAPTGQPSHIIFTLSSNITDPLSFKITALLLYDYFLLLPDEIRVFWACSPRLSLSSVLFIINRYFWLFAAPFAVGTKFTPAETKVRDL